MSNSQQKRWMACVLLFSIVICELMSGSGIRSQARQKREADVIEEPAEESTMEPTAVPTAEPTEVPTATPVPTPVTKYVLANPDAKYYKGGQKGIRYKKISGVKIYHLTSYTTDAVKLTMSHASTYQIYGGGSKKEVTGKTVRISSSGVVRCRKKKEGQAIYTIIQAKSKLTGEVQYIYINFKKNLTCRNGRRLSLYEKKSQTLSFNYGKRNLKFSIKNKKVATVNKKGQVKAKKKGTTYVTVKVRDSEKNELRIRIVVKEEPWLVNDKDKVYDYNDMTADLRRLVYKYPGKAGLSSLGKSYDGRDIWCLRIGSAYAGKRLVIDAAIHGREWKNTQVLMRQAEEILREYNEHKDRFRNVCLYLIPMDNPDGVTISQYGYQGIRNKKLQKKVKKIGHFRKWKNNARGVNLNNNFPAGFSVKKKKKPDYAAYPGKKAGSEKEAKALMKFIQKIRPNTVLNLHSTGSVLYWDFAVDEALHNRQYQLAKKINSYNRYRMMPRNGSTEERGGFADWLVYEKKIPSVTIETGSVMCPLPHSQYSSIYKKNNKMFRWFMLRY